MAANKNKKTESSEDAEKSYELKKLRDEVEDVCKLFHVEDSGLAQSEDLARISEVLDKINEKIKVRTDGDGSKKEQDDGDGSKKEQDKDDGDGSKKEQDKDELILPLSKRKELAELLPLLKAALKQCMQPAGVEGPAPPADNKHLPSVVAAATGCYPCKPRRQHKEEQPEPEPEPDEEEEDKAGGAEEAPVLSLKLLHRLVQNVLEPEQYYEWTTSYVDEDRLYGWNKEAGDVVDSLIAAPKDDDGGKDPMFRAAGIAGIHGSGKTALAQRVFVHDKAKDNFAIRLWVCVGPPDSEDRFNLLYRMLDNLGLDTAKVEDDIVAKSNVVTQATEKEVERMKKEEVAEVDKLRKEAAAKMAKKKPAGDAPQPQADAHAHAAADTSPRPKEEEDKEEEERIFNQLLREKAQDSKAVQRSKIGVLLYILHVTLSKTSYLIVFDDIRMYGDDGWYSNLTLPPPPEGEWGDRLAYGLPKWTKHKGAVLVTCRKEDDAKAMVRTGRVFHPPKLEGEDAWNLFTREYKQAKKDAANNKEQQQPEKKEDDDVLLKDLAEIQKQIVDKCLGLPVAIIEAARGFALLDPLTPPTTDVPDLGDNALKEEAAAAAAAGNKPTTTEDHQTSSDTVRRSKEEEDDDGEEDAN